MDTLYLSNESKVVQIDWAISEKTKVSSRRASLKITFPVISPEAEVSAIIRLNLIDGTMRAFKWTQVYSNRFSHLWKTLARIMYRKKSAHTHTHIHTHTHTQTFSDLVELSRMVYNTRCLRGSVKKSVSPAILLPFYRERQNGFKRN